MAQDISITLGLDDSQYTQAINRATQSLNEFANKAKAALQGVSDGVGKVGDSVDTLASKFNSLGSTIVGVGLGAFIANAIQASADATRMAESIGVSTQHYMELGLAMNSVGKDQDSLGRLMLRMDATLGQANDGSARLVDAYHRLGISMDYASQHTPYEVFIKASKALSEVTSATERAELTMMIFGRDAKTIPWAEFTAQAEKFAGSQKENADATEKAAQFYRDMKVALSQLSIEIVKLIEGFTGLTGDDLKGILGSKKAAETLLVIFGAITAGKFVTGFLDIVKAVKSLGEVFIFTSGAAAVGTASTTAYADSLILAEKQALTYTAGLSRVATATNAVAVAQLKLDAAIESNGIMSTQAAAAANTLAAAEERLAMMSAAAAATQAELSVQFGLTAATATEATVAATTATGVFARIGAVLTGIATAVGGFIAAIGLPEILAGLAAIAVAVGAITIVWKAFGDIFTSVAGNVITWVKEIGSSITTWITDKIDAAANSLRKFTDYIGMTTAKAAPGAQASYSNEGRAGTHTTGSNEMPATSGNAADPNATQKTELANLQAQFAMLQANNKAVADRLDLEIKLAGASEATRKSQLEAFDANKKYQDEISKIDMKISDTKIKMTSTEGKYHKEIYQQILDELEQEKAKLANNNVLLSQKVEKLTQAKNLAAMELYYSDTRLKVEKNLADITNSMNELTMTNDQKKIANINKLIAADQEAALKKRQAQLGDIQMSDTEANAIKQRVADMYEVQKVATQNEIDLSRQWSTGWTAAFNQYVEDGTNAAKMAQQAFDSMTKNMNNAIDTFVDTGKFSFSDLANSIIKDLIKIELKAQATQLLGALGGGGTAALAGGGLIGTIAGLLGFAGGGDPPVGKASIVGEKGPELFVPKQAGTIIPNGAMSAAQPTVTNTYITNNISALDSKSVAQMFAENRKQLLGTVQLAQKELPYGNR